MAAFFSNLFSKKKSSFQVADIYLELRNQVFDLSKKGAEERKAFGTTDRMAIIVETGMDDGCYTLVAVSDGSASLYFNNGGGIIGAGQHPPGAEAAKKFIEFSRQFDTQLKTVEEYPLPLSGQTRFYIIKPGEILSVAFKEDDLGNNKVPLSPLFHKGHELITTIRFLDERQRLENPLIIAILDDLVDSVRECLKKGVDANTVDSKGIPALALAVSFKQEEIVSELLIAGANPNVKISDEEKKIRNSPILNFAAANGSIRIAKILINSGAKTEDSDASGLTPLMSAAYMGHPEILELLIRAGSSLEQKDKSGYTALTFASNAGHEKCVEILLNSGADVNASDNDGSIPIMFASQHGFNDIVKLLLAKGADPYMTGSHGLSAIAFAHQNRRNETEIILKQQVN